MGNHPVLNYTLNNKSYQGLWDSGSISLINKEWLHHKFPETEMHSIDRVIGTQKGQFRLKAASNTDTLVYYHCLISEYRAIKLG